MLPPIYLTAQDADRLDNLLASQGPGRHPELEAELARAEILKGPAPADLVVMNAKVQFRIVATGEQFSRTLVFPKDAGQAGSLSILAPLGSALIGLKVGDSIQWPKPGGGLTQVSLDAVTPPSQS
ncbi:GreA/GreB family elongation factor [Gallaecimonas xiamenensis]|uniref:GreA/GreB family elongation factor n=1 Tax=Gallaecimonas xiamenensis 3-C-1 TaxID=745411 RepID=K2JJG7_9GAMM|nr:GreA/GreB family elongation factor [Gallaecimonas xiamenensis]EKE75468.1 GreA/GreB family elongation factor [Gallaecimonas xiamenensis 3-C-1]